MTDDYSTEYIKEIYERNVDDIYGICFSYLKNIHDCEKQTYFSVAETRKSMAYNNGLQPLQKYTAFFTSTSQT